MRVFWNRNLYKYIETEGKKRARRCGRSWRRGNRPWPSCVNNFELMSYLCRQLPLLHQQLLVDATTTRVTRPQQVEEPHKDNSYLIIIFFLPLSLCFYPSLFLFHSSFLALFFYIYIIYSLFLFQASKSVGIKRNQRNERKKFISLTRKSSSFTRESSWNWWEPLQTPWNIHEHRQENLQLESARPSQSQRIPRHLSGITATTDAWDKHSCQESSQHPGSILEASWWEINSIGSVQRNQSDLIRV